MDLKDQLKSLFPNHQEESEPKDNSSSNFSIWMQEDPLECHFQKRNGKPTTIVKKYTGATKDFKLLTKEIKTYLGVGGSFKDDEIIIQGDYRDKIMQLLHEIGFKTKRVGG
jgi:translation initiation factor 1